MTIQEHAKARYDALMPTKGPINVETDPRDWKAETLEELADAWNYLDYLAEKHLKEPDYNDVLSKTAYTQVVLDGLYEIIKKI